MRIIYSWYSSWPPFKNGRVRGDAVVYWSQFSVCFISRLCCFYFASEWKRLLFCTFESIMGFLWFCIAAGYKTNCAIELNNMNANCTLEARWSTYSEFRDSAAVYKTNPMKMRVFKSYSQIDCDNIEKERKMLDSWKYTGHFLSLSFSFPLSLFLHLHLFYSLPFCHFA